MKANLKTAAMLGLAGVAAIGVWLYRRAQTSAATAPASQPLRYVFGDIGARIVNEDATDEVVKALLASASQLGNRITYEDAGHLLVIQQNRQLYDNSIVTPWGSNQPERPDPQ